MPLGAARLGAGARVRHPRDHRRGGDRPRHPGQTRPRRARVPRRAARTPAAADLGRDLRAAVRLLRRRDPVQRAAPSARCSPTAPRSACCSAWWSARPSVSSAAPSLAVRAGLAELPEPTGLARPRSRSRCSPAAASRSACSSPSSPSPTGEQQDRIKAAVLLGSLIASLLAAALLRRRARAHSCLTVTPRGAAPNGVNLLDMTHVMLGSPMTPCVMTDGAVDAPVRQRQRQPLPRRRAGHRAARAAAARLPRVLVGLARAAAAARRRRLPGGRGRPARLRRHRQATARLRRLHPRRRRRPA